MVQFTTKNCRHLFCNYTVKLNFIQQLHISHDLTQSCMLGDSGERVHFGGRDSSDYYLLCLITINMANFLKLNLKCLSPPPPKFKKI